MKKNILLFVYLITFSNICLAQIITIDNYSVNSIGQVQLSIQAQASKYYILQAQHSATFEWETSMTLGVNGTMVISEPAAAYPLSNYTITAYDIASPGDIDGDGIDDITEFNNMPTDAPLNFASPIAIIDGATSIPDAQTFNDLATVNNVGWAPFLDDQQYVKFGILDRDSPNPKVYFINSNTYTVHASFWNGIGASVSGDDGSGEIVFNPIDISPNGVIGSYSFNFSFGDAKDFEASQRTYELLIANMPFLQNNMNHFIGQSDENNHLNNYAADFVGSRVEVVLESDVFAEINYIPFHEAEGYGFFKHMTSLNESPSSRDIVLYDALPNSLPRVGGIITSVIQTPLSHVNLRAIQDDVPNAYIKDPLLIDSISDLLGDYIYYKVANDKYTIRKATLTEVNDWYEDLRPTQAQIPIRDLSVTKILPLDSIEFEMSTAFGAKCSNVATMQSFGFPSGTIPDGFGIPFYYYDEFMKYNNFYLEAEVMINNPTFSIDLNFRIQRLKDFRKSIKDASMPQWILDDLQAMHDAFPVGTKVRCRSSTNNEDLPGFSGAGLYTSKTQHLDEGHISKSVKQVYASMWNFRAYEERDFYRVDHYIAAMGILCHSNFEGEQSNGVGISIDPVYETDSTFYLNTQVGESLITNPDPNTVPEEILLYEDSTNGAGYLVLRLSNLVNPGDLVMDQIYLDQMREYLTVIHDEFAILYDVVGAEGFGMDIEYKVTAQNQLIIKQARPWVSFWADVKANNDLEFTEILNPQSSSSLGSNELVTAKISNTGLKDMNGFDISLMVDGSLIETINISDTIKPFEDADFQFLVPQDFATVGDYDITGIVYDIDDEYANNDTLNIVLSKLHLLDGELSIGSLNVLCDDVVEVNVTIVNHGENTITDAEIQVVVNGLAVDTINVSLDIPFQGQGSVAINVDENLQALNNNITLNILSVNNLTDGDLTNNSASTTTDLGSDYDVITFIINPDNYPQETSWELFDEVANRLVASGSLQSGATSFSEDICVNYNSCFSLFVYDSYGDGICCSFGNGDFSVLNSSGSLLVNNNGDFGHEAQEFFCPNGIGCSITAAIDITNTSLAGINDGSITINTNSGINPFQYSIDGGITFFQSNSFDSLAAGNYNIFIQGAAGLCSFQDNISIQSCAFTSADIIATLVSSTIMADGSIEIIPTSGISPYLYSIDDGQNFVSSNIFLNLAVGDYNVIIQDAQGICSYEQQVPVKVCKINADITILDASSEFATDGAIIINPTSGTAPYEYSIDGGQTFVNINAFLDLAAGTYDVVFSDGSGICNYEKTTVIEFDSDTTANVNSIADVLFDGIMIFPNPTSDNFKIVIEESSMLTDEVNFEVYDNFGRKIQIGIISKSGDNFETTISLAKYASGTYFIKCHSSSFEKHFKIIKI
jgi:hypothetical protein